VVRAKRAPEELTRALVVQYAAELTTAGMPRGAGWSSKRFRKIPFRDRCL